MSGFDLRRRPRPGLSGLPDRGGLDLRMMAALGVGLLVTLLALGSMVGAGAGVYYDDGVYLALARSLADGGGYVYANLPGQIPGVKYPPLYPAVLATALELLPPYPDNLFALKALNAVFIGLAATLSLLAFGAAWGGPWNPSSGPGTARTGVVIPDHDESRPLGRSVVLGVLAIVALLGHGSAQTMVLATALLSEPLFLVAAFAALLVAGRRGSHPALVGLLAAAAFLTRGIGIAIFAALLLAELLRPGTRFRRRLRRLGFLAIGALPPMAAWLAWSGTRADRVPAPLAGQYGSYTDWYAAGEGASIGVTPARLLEIGGAHWTPFLSNLEMLWIPDAAETTANFVLVVLGLVTLVGAVRIARRNLALALFPFLYLAVVLAWPYEPDRFFYAIIPTLTLLLATGGLSLAERIREDLPRWGGPAAAVVAGLLLLNSAAYQIDAHANRAWTIFQAAPAAAYAPLNEWIRENTAADAVVASGLDPHVYWETGRAAVPNFQFLAADYGQYDDAPETLVREFEAILGVIDVRWVAVIRGEGKAGATMAAFAETRPERSRLAYEADGGGVTAQVWEVLPPGEMFSPERSLSPPSSR